MNRVAGLLFLLLASCAAPPAAPAPFYADKQNLLVWIDADGRPQPVRRAADWERRRLHILENFQKVSGSIPADDPPVDLRVEGEVREEAFVRKAVTFAAAGGDRVPAFLFIPQGLTRPAPAVLCLHQTTPLGKKEPAGMGNRNLAYAKELAQRGLVTLAPDYPGFGDYKPDVYAAGWASATAKGIANHRAAVTALQSLPEVDGRRIGAIGHSLGGHNSIFVAVFDPRIKAVVSSCGFNAFPRYYGGKLGGWSHKGYMPRIAAEYGTDPARMPFDFTELVAALAPRPFFINAPLLDSNFDVLGVMDCVKAARPVYELLGAPEALVAVHPDAGHDFPPEIRGRAYEFLEEALGP